MKKLVAISGSLRKASVNTAILHAVARRAPPGVDFTVHDIAALPLFNEDLEADPPPAVAQLVAAVRGADGLVLASPEYNHGTSGVMKNVLDWLSRPYGNAPLAGKRVLALTSSSGYTGGVRSSEQLNTSLNAVGAIRLHYPQIVVPWAQGKMVDGVFCDTLTVDSILDGLARF